MIAISRLISEALVQPKDAVFLHLSQALKLRFPDHYILETEADAFKPYHFAHAGLATLLRFPNHSQWTFGYDAQRDRAMGELSNGFLELGWRDQEFTIVTTGIEGNHCRDERSYIVGPNEAITREFFVEVCRHNSEVHAEVLVFSGGGWSKSEELHEDIKTADLGQLVLEGELKNEMIRDFTTFFASESLFRDYGLPWKRGALFLGPPGNGKTHMIKGLTQLLSKPVLYVKSFKHPYDTDHNCIQRVFKRAREMAPCMLILEDLDSLVDDGNRSFFLNEMDGFASNDGILTLATANFPEKLDPAILERPSRFDRKYHFELPGAECRMSFLANFGERLAPTFRLSSDSLEAVVDATEGFSFAYLKELYLSSLMAWVSAPEPKPDFTELMTSQTTTLLSQQHTDPGAVRAEPENPMLARIRKMREGKF